MLFRSPRFSDPCILDDFVAEELREYIQKNHQKSLMDYKNKFPDFIFPQQELKQEIKLEDAYFNLDRYLFYKYEVENHPELKEKLIDNSWWGKSRKDHDLIIQNCVRKILYEIPFDYLGATPLTDEREPPYYVSDANMWTDIWIPTEVAEDIGVADDTGSNYSARAEFKYTNPDDFSNAFANFGVEVILQSQLIKQLVLGD